MAQLASKSLMREAGLEPAYPKVPDPKSGDANGLPLGDRAEQGPASCTPLHRNAPESTRAITPDVTRPETLSVDGAGSCHIARSESLPLDNAVIRNVLHALHEGRPLSGWTPDTHGLASSHYSAQHVAGWWLPL